MSNSQWRKIESLPEGVDTLHYTSCGLENIVLAGGFARHETKYGKGVSIEDVEGLHQAIAESLIAREDARLQGPEIRFLRKEMGYTQVELAQLLQVDEQSLGRWEKSSCSISGPADLLLRALYKQARGYNANLKKISQGIHPAAEYSSKDLVFKVAA